MKNIASALIFFLSLIVYGNEVKKPNVLFIAIDDLNDWTGYLKGNPQAKTPHLDRLASKGIAFTNAHCTAPACGPSRASLMSGILPSTSGNYINSSSLTKNPVLSKAVLLPEFFQKNGYQVLGAGKLYHGAHFILEIQGRGFDEYYPNKKRDLPPFKKMKLSTGKNSYTGIGGGPLPPGSTVLDLPDGKTAKWTEEKLLGGELKEPFFLAAGIFQPHLPNYAPKEYFDRFPLDQIKIPEGYKEDDRNDVPKASSKMANNPWLKKIREAGKWKHAIQAYLACSAMTDDLVGQIVEALEKSKYADNTIVVLWSDHGFQLGEKELWAKYSLWERATKVNMIWIAPGVTKAGSVCSKPVNLLDIYPTLASLTNCTPPKNQLEGNDLSGLMKNPEASWDKNSVTVFGYKNYGIRSERYRYIVYEDGSEELYDHQKDNWEWQNLAKNPEYTAIKEKLRKSTPTHHQKYGPTQKKVPKSFYNQPLK